MRTDMERDPRQDGRVAPTIGMALRNHPQLGQLFVHGRYIGRAAHEGKGSTLD